MHSHGGNVLEYYPLANQLDSDQPVYALQARGLDGHINKDQSLEEMAAAYLDEVRRLQATGPYILGGFCFGGLLALEAAQQLSNAGEEVALVIMIQTVRPGSIRFKPSATSFHRWWYRATKQIDLERENLSHRGKGYIYERCRRSWDIAWARSVIAFDNFVGNGRGSQPRTSVPYILETLGMKHDKVYEEYRPRPYRGNVVLCRAKRQLSGLVADPYLGWKDILIGGVDICEVPGHQQNIMLEPNVSRLAEELGSRLSAAQRRLELDAKGWLAATQ